jgi:hypothetical protein
MNAVEHALLALVAARGGDAAAAQDHLARARGETQATARRHRQIVEIATLIVAGNTGRAGGLAVVHTSEFPEDARLLEHVC